MATNADTVHRFYEEMLNRRRLELAGELLAPDVTTHGDEDRTGQESILGVDKFLRAGFPDLRFQIDDVLVQDDRAATRWTMTGTHEGPFLGIAPTGRQITLRGNVFFGFRDGKVTDIWPVIDVFGLRAQLADA